MSREVGEGAKGFIGTFRKKKTAVFAKEICNAGIGPEKKVKKKKNPITLLYYFFFYLNKEDFQSA